jgi:hypothetical protein
MRVFGVGLLSEGETIVVACTCDEWELSVLGVDEVHRKIRGSI